jgi:hypothetical protein
MATFILTDVPEELHALLRASAERNRRSLNSEILVRLEGTFTAPLARLPDYGRALKSFTIGMPQVDHEGVDVYKRRGRP